MAGTIAQAIDCLYARLEMQLLRVAEAMPAEEFAFRPSPEVRTFGEQLRHVAAVQWVVGSAVLGEKPPVDVGDGDNGALALTNKPEILRYAADSFVYLRRAVASLDDRRALEVIGHPYDPERTKLTRLSLLAEYACHGWEHYGQMVIYQRLKGIVPPPSRLVVKS